MIANKKGYSVAASQVVAIGGTSTQSTALSTNTSLVRLCCTVDVYIQIGLNPTATSASVYLPAKTPEYFAIRQGLGELIAGLQVTGAGSLSVAEMVI